MTPPIGRAHREQVWTLKAEHEEVGGVLEKMRELTEGYRPPEGACNTYGAMLDGLEELERDVHMHVHSTTGAERVLLGLARSTELAFLQ